MYGDSGEVWNRQINAPFQLAPAIYAAYFFSLSLKPSNASAHSRFTIPVSVGISYNDLLAIDDAYWYYDTVDGSFYYDETADQNMEDAVKIAEVTSDGDPLTEDDLASSEISYNSDTI